MQEINMATKESESEDIRQRIDEQDRLDTEEIMVNASTNSSESRSSRSSSSNQRLVRAPRPLASTSVASSRRIRPPAIPPPPPNMKKSSTAQDKQRYIYNTFWILLVGIGVVGVAVIGVIETSHHQNPTTFRTKASPVIVLNKPVRLRRTVSQNHQIQQTKYAGSEIPKFYQTNMKDFTDLNHDGEIPLLWRIPFSGDEAWTEIIGTCLKLTQAADKHELLGAHVAADELQYVESPRGTFFNLDLSEREGIEQAKAVNLTSLDRVNIITSPSLSVLSLFDNATRQGRALCTLRHPASRLMSYFYGAKDAKSQYYDPTLEDVTLEEYVASPGDRVEFNFMVKSLVSSGTDLISTADITLEDLNLAKTILQQKFIILLADDMFGSWMKLESYLGWPFPTQEQRKCEDSILSLDWTHRGSDTQEYRPLGDSEAAYSQLVNRNMWDVALYEYAVSLFQQQTNVLIKL
jgi:hypothetical protein